MKIALSGNAFVDTGLSVIAALGGLNDVTTLTLAKVREVFGDGTQLAEWNRRLPTFTQVFGTNGPLFQKGYGYKKGVGPSERNLTIYRGTLRAFLEAISAGSKGSPCAACGGTSDFDFSSACGKVIEAAEAKAPDEKWVGRDWFPLSGSLGSDAQALPVASRPVHLCPRCLFAVHYLPLALISVEGRLAVFQSASVEFWYDLVRDIVGETRSRISLGDYNTPGTKDGSRAISRRLLTYFRRVREAGRAGAMPQGASLQIWRFTNSGASPDCEVNEIPNESLVFMWNAVERNLQSELESLISNEPKIRDLSLFRCISERRDYPGLYPRGKYAGASPKLFALYQTEVCGRPARALSLAQTLARQAATEVKAKELSRLQRSEAFRTPAARNRFRRLMSELARQNDFTLADYLLLFPPNDDERGVGVRSDGWNIIRYYLHHVDDHYVSVGMPGVETPNNRRIEKVVYYAGRIFSVYVAERGVGRFESDVLQRAGMGHLGRAWLQRQFTRLAAEFSGFTHAAWEVLCLNDAGQSCLSEVLFQMRLLWAEWLRNGTSPSDGIPAIQNGSGLFKSVEGALTAFFTGYVQQRGVVRFHRDIIMRLQQRTIGLGWLRRQLVNRGRRRHEATMSENDWEELLKDDTGNLAPSLRLFQMHLHLANLYREMIENHALAGKLSEEKRL